MKVIKEKILKLHVSMKVKSYAFSWGVLNHITHKVLHVSTNWCSLAEPITIKCPCLRSQNFYKRAPLNWEFSTSGLCKPQYIYKWASSIRTFSTKNEAFGWTNPQARKIFKQWETSTTHTYAASATRARGANVDTYFHDTFRTSPIQLSLTSLWTRFMYYILFILLSMAQARATYGGNWGSVAWRVWVGSFQTFCMSPAHACY